MGNEFRRDDGVGLVILRTLQPQLPAEIQTMEVSDSGADLLEAWLGAETVYLFDAIRSATNPGTIQCIDLQAQTLPVQEFSCSTHTFSLADAIELARSFNQLPPRLIIYGVVGQDFTTGVGLSPAVELAVADVVKEVLSIFQTHSDDPL
uniref:Hydrogenase maturation protease n=1 Tax=Cyanothece sp. (strain PCC 7425 / ATCC 29141) TaxID=395961 RepID=B8HJQ9_CYAP4